MGVKFKSNGVIIFEIDHNNGEKTLRQNLEIRPDIDIPMKWVAGMNFDGFPACDTPHDAALLLATWMERMAVEIMGHRNFNKIDFSENHPDTLE